MYLAGPAVVGLLLCAGVPSTPAQAAKASAIQSQTTDGTTAPPLEVALP